MDRSRAAMSAISILALVLAACGAAGPAPAAPPAGTATAAAEPIIIGAPLAFTGASSVFAEMQRNGIQLAVDEVNANGGIDGRKVEVQFVDTQFTNDGAVSAFQSLIQNGVLALIGPTTTPQLFATAPVAAQAGVPLLVPAVAAEGVADVSPFIHRVSAPESIIVPNAVKAAVEQYKPKTAALIWQGDQPFNVAGGKAMEKTFQEAGVTIVTTQTFTQNDVDFSPQLTQIVNAKPDIIGIAALTQQGIQLVTQARRLGLTQPFVVNKGFSGAGVLGQVQDLADGTIVGAQWSNEDPKPANQSFVKGFKEKFDRDPDEFAALAYDATNILFQVVGEAGPDVDRAEVQDLLAKLESYDGVSSKMEFFTTEKGGRDVRTAGVVLIAKGGAWTRLE